MDEGVIQIEEFGMHISVDGSLMYGMFIEAVMSDYGGGGGTIKTIEMSYNKVLIYNHWIHPMCRHCLGIS